MSTQEVHISQDSLHRGLSISKEDTSSDREVGLLRPAEAKYPSPPKLNVAAPISTAPFSFLQLPREIRDLIYFYALLHPESPLSVEPRNIYCYLLRESDVWPHRILAPDRYRGMQTDLFRVNGQFSTEVSEVLYSEFPVHFELIFDAALDYFTHPDIMLLRNRSFIKSVGFTMILDATKSTFTVDREGNVRQDLQTVLKCLPNVRRVDLAFRLQEPFRQEPEIKDVVERLVHIASSLQDVADLTLHCGDMWCIGRKRVVFEVHQALALCKQVNLCPRMYCKLNGTLCQTGLSMGEHLEPLK